MSFDIFFIAMKQRKTSAIPMQDVLQAFEGLCELERITDQRDGKKHIRWNTLPGDDKWGYVTISAFEGDENLCRDVSIHRPTNDPVFWKTMFGLMEKFPLGLVLPTTNSDLCWILANESFRGDFQNDDDMPIVIISTPEELCETISNDHVADS